MRAEMAIYTLDGKRLSSKVQKLDILPANALSECFRADLSAAKGVHIVRLTLKDTKNSVISQNDYLRSVDGSFNTMDSEKIRLDAMWNKDGSFTVKNPGKVAAVGVKFNTRYLAAGVLQRRLCQSASWRVQDIHCILFCEGTFKGRYQRGRI